MTSNLKPIQFSGRIRSRIERKGTRGNVIKSCAELIKNSDDSYFRKDSKNSKTRHIIEVGYWRGTQQKRKSIVGFYIRDWAQGMNRETIRKAYEIYGEDTARGGRSSAIGVGGKDALMDMEKAFVITSQNGKPIVVSIETDKKEGLMSQVWEGKAAIKEIDNFNKNDLHSKKIPKFDITQNGTMVFFRLSKKNPGTRIDTFIDRISKYYTLRTIFDDKSRFIKLVDVDKRKSKFIRHKLPPGKVTKKDKFTLKYKNKNYKISYTIKKSKSILDKNQEYGYNLLIHDEEGGVLDNTLFTYQKDTAASKIFGEIVINDWKKLQSADLSVMTDNREGLDFKHKFNEKLENKMISVLKPIILAESKSSDIKISDKINKNIKNAFKKLNKIMAEETGKTDGDGGEDEREINPAGLQFSPSIINMPTNETRKTQLYVNPDTVPVDSEISLDISGSSVKVKPKNKIRTPSYYSPNEDYPSIEIEVESMNKEGNSEIKATYGKYESKLEVNVITRKLITPEHGFDFIPPKTMIFKGLKKKLRLYIDTKKFKVGSKVKIVSNDKKIKIHTKYFKVPKPNVYGSISLCNVEVSSKSLGTKTTIEASTTIKQKNETKRKTRKKLSDKKIKAICEVRVIEKRGPEQFFKGWKPDPDANPAERVHYNKGIVHIHTKSPVLEKYFGPNHERLHKKDFPDAMAILAESILQCVLPEMAREYLRTGAEIELSNNEEVEIQRIKNKLDHKHGKLIHDTIFGKV